MTDIHEVQCNMCGRKGVLEFNGEHYLHPKGWFMLYCAHESEITDEHICDHCHERTFKHKKPEIKNDA